MASDPQERLSSPGGLSPSLHHIIRIALAIVACVTFTLPGFAQTVAGGDAHTVVATPDGNVWTWGNNGSSRLGLGAGAGSHKKVPTPVTTFADVVAVAAGSDFTLALDSSGFVWAWGNNTYGQLGLGDTTTRHVPTQLGLTGIVAIAAGNSHSVALNSTGDVFTWGENAAGQLGNGSTTRSNTPIQLTTPTSVIAIAAGSNHTLTVKSDHTVWGWGRNVQGQLGIGNNNPNQRTSPVQMSGITTATAVAGGTDHSLILLSDGTVRSAGINNTLQLGISGPAQHSPVTVTGLTGVTAIGAGLYHSVVRKSDGTVRVFGASSQLGTSATSNSATPVTPTGLPSTIAFITAGGTHSLAITDDGVVWAWGYNGDGHLGDGTPHARSTPIRISDLAYDWLVGMPWFSPNGYAGGQNQTVTITEETPGTTTHYTLNGDDPTESDPTITSGATILIDRVRTLKARAWKSGMPESHIGSAVYTLTVAQPTASPTQTTHQAPVTVSLSTTTAGATIHYTLDGNTPTTASPVYAGSFLVSTTTTVKAVGAKDGWVTSSAFSRTYNMDFGQLTAPTMTPAAGSYTSSVNVELASIPGATIRYTTNGSTPGGSSTIYAGPLTLTATTTLKAYATHLDYDDSPVATGTYTIVVAAPVFAPVGGTYAPGQTMTVTSATSGATIRYTLDGREPTASDASIASGASLVAGNYTLKASAWKTGATTSATTTATYALSGTLAAATVSADWNHSFAVRPDGTVWGWGSNGSGDLGNGTTLNPQRFPTQVRGLTGATDVTSGNAHTVARRVTGDAVSWGSNNGQGLLGDGTSGGSRSLFGPVSALTTVVAVSAGSQHTLALTSDGTVWAWGLNTYYRLGDGSTTNRLAPVAVDTITNAIAIAAGFEFSAALKSDGTVWTWGRNEYGQLGDGTTQARTTVAVVPGVTDVVAIAAGFRHVVALKSDGTLVTWGRNNYGQLGRSGSHILGPGAVSGLTSVTAIAAGTEHSMVLRSDGTVWSVGANDDGQLGDGMNDAGPVPVQAVGLTDVIRIDAGSYHAIALTSDLTVWTWGSNGSGQLGDGTSTTQSVPTPMSGPNMMWRVLTPTLSFDPEAQIVTVTSLDPDATLHYTTSGVEPTESDPTIASGGTVSIPESLTLKVKGWKTDTLPSLVATATYELKVVMPVVTPVSGTYGTAQNVSIATTTPGATIRYTTDGTDPVSTSTLYTGLFSVGGPLTVRARAYKTNWTTSDGGYATYAITGAPVDTPVITPAAGSHTGPILVTMITATTGATIRYTLDGSTPTVSSAPFTIPLLVDTTTTVTACAFKPGHAPSAAASASYALDPAGHVGTPTIAPAGGRFATRQTVTITGPVGATLHYTMSGADPTESDPTIASGGTLVVDRSLPLKVKAWQVGSTPSAIRRADFLITGALSLSSGVAMALKSDRTLWTWGVHAQGLGDGVTTRHVPGQVATDVVAISTAHTHSLFVKADGRVWAWGSGNGYVLGTGSTGPEPTAVQLATPANVIAVSASQTHSMALKADGTVWAWGGNSDGQLGDGTTTSRPTAVQVVGLSGVRAIAAGNSFSLALADDGGAGGAVWAWGSNWNGELGDGTNVDRLYPVRVALPKPIVAIAAGASHAMALANDGTVWTWGSNLDGQLGNNTTTLSRVPMQVVSLPGVRALAVGSSRSYAIREDGHVWSWGEYGATGISEGMGLQGAALIPYRADKWPEILLADGGHSSILFARLDGSVWGSGTNSNGILGTGTTSTGWQDLVAASGLILADNSWLVADSDGDSVPTWRELLNGLDPLSADSDGDGLPDGAESMSSQPGAHPDADGDGVPNGVEVTRGTDPFAIDTDGDGVNDRLDAFPLDPTRTTAPPPTPGDTTPPIITLIEPTNAIPIPP